MADYVRQLVRLWLSVTVVLCPLIPAHSRPKDGVLSHACAGIQGHMRVDFFVYILANKPNGTLYIGMTDNLVQRVWQHRNEVIPGFTQRYGVKTLVWFESHNSRESAFIRERRLKKWQRAWKLALIEQTNPLWRDLWPEISPP